MTLSVETLTGAAIAPYLSDLARLRISVFREWPYLYDGSAAYEEEYLELYVRSPGAAVILARDGDKVIGASTCLPMADETDAVREPLEHRGLDCRDYFYFGESVLMPEFRGNGLGVRFFKEREAHARTSSAARFAMFCAVRRSSDHPLRPQGATTLLEFWSKRGFQPLPGISCIMSWKEPGDPGEIPHRLDFFIKSLHGEAIPASLLHEERDQ